MTALRPAIVPGATICGLQRYQCDERGLCREHRGIDLCAPSDSPIFCPFPGLVERSYFTESAGETMVLRHSPHLLTVYLHLKRRIARVGQYVLPGRIIATVGNTGRRYDGRPMGHHLHLEFDRYWPAPREDEAARYDALSVLRSWGLVMIDRRLWWRPGYPARRASAAGSCGLLGAAVFGTLATR